MLFWCCDTIAQKVRHEQARKPKENNHLKKSLIAVSSDLGEFEKYLSNQFFPPAHNQLFALLQISSHMHQVANLQEARDASKPGSS